jgi:hypothetical protein
MTPFSASPDLAVRMVHASLDDERATRREALIRARRRRRRTQRVLTRL